MRSVPFRREGVHGREPGFRMQTVVPKSVEKLLQNVTVLVIDDNAFMRKLVRNILTNIGVKTTLEAADGLSGLETIRMFAPDLVVLDWEMPMLNGAELVRIVRSPGVFPVPDVPIIMLTGHVERWRIVEASRLGVHEFLRKPVSGRALLERIVSILLRPRPMVRLGDYYGPEPRRTTPDATIDYAQLHRAAKAKRPAAV